MHIVAFALKRGHYAALRVERPLAAKFGLTPARFDMLYCIHLHENTFFRQSTLRRMLGVSSPVVCRMLRALIDLGLVLRCVDCEDQRHLNVRLSPKGRATMRAAIAATIGEGLPHLAFDVALAGPRWFDEATCIEQTRSTTDLLRRVAATFRDEATLDYGVSRRPRPVALVLRPDAAAPPERRRRRRRTDFFAGAYFELRSEPAADAPQ